MISMQILFLFIASIMSIFMQEVLYPPSNVGEDDDEIPLSSYGAQ